MRPLPAELAEKARAACRLEELAALDGLVRERAAIVGTNSLMLATVLAGWTQAAICRALELPPRTVSLRIATARARYGDDQPGLELPQAPCRPPRPPTPAAYLQQPVEQRQWLTRAEAVELTGRDMHTIWLWRQAGRLPNT